MEGKEIGAIIGLVGLVIVGASTIFFNVNKLNNNNSLQEEKPVSFDEPNSFSGGSRRKLKKRFRQSKRKK
jgi:hypothetical protein